MTELLSSASAVLVGVHEIRSGKRGQRNALPQTPNVVPRDFVTTTASAIFVFTRVRMRAVGCVARWHCR
jgi:hypothetical protein